MTSMLDDILRHYETRAQAAIALVYDPEKQPSYSEVVGREAELARQYLCDVGELTDMVRRYRISASVSIDTIRTLSQNPPADDKRASGRTTRLLLRGLIALSEGQNVMILAATTSHAKHLADQLRVKAREFGVPLDDIEAPTIRHAWLYAPNVGFRGVTLIDHYAIEKIESKL